MKSMTGLPNQRNNLKTEPMETFKLIVKWVLIIGAIILFDRACSPRDISKMPPRMVLIESYSMYNPAGIKSAYQKFDSLRANAPFAQRSDSLEASAEANGEKELHAIAHTFMAGCKTVDKTYKQAPDNVYRHCWQRKGRADVLLNETRHDKTCGGA